MPQGANAGSRRGSMTLGGARGYNVRVPAPADDFYNLEDQGGGDFVQELFEDPDDTYNATANVGPSPAPTAPVADDYNTPEVQRGRGRSVGAPPPMQPLRPTPVANRSAPPIGAGPKPPQNTWAVGSTGTRREMRGLHGDSRSEDQAKQVKYLGNDAAREKYRVTIERVMKRRGQMFDTKWVKDHFRAKDPSVLVGFGNVNRMSPQWLDSCIWVCAPNASDRAVFYSHVCKLNKFHHSTFMGGSGVIAAGEWVVSQGRLRSFSGNSGHYRTEMKQLYQAALHLRDAVRPDTTVAVWDMVQSGWVERPYKEFVADPYGKLAGGGPRYKVNPVALS